MTLLYKYSAKLKCVLGNSYDINADTKKNAWKSPFNSIGPFS